MQRNWWILLVAVIALILVVLLFTNRPAPAASNGASVAISLKTVPNIRSVTVSPDKTTFSNCTGGNPDLDTKSTSTELGYPNGHCWAGDPSGSFPIKIKYTGPPGQVFVSSSNAVPSAGGSQWSLCSTGCSGSQNLPGTDQYTVKNFGANRNTSTGLAGSLTCDHEFGSQGCSAKSGQTQNEGVELIGPETTANTSSTSWTVTITWAAAPPPSS